MSPSSPNLRIRDRVVRLNDGRELVAILLQCGPVAQPLVDQFGISADVMKGFFHSGMKLLGPSANYDQLTLKSYRVYTDDAVYPSDTVLRSADAVIMNGSGSSANDDKPWINRLYAFIASIRATYPRIKLFGICFGHQLLARALGGKVAKIDGPREFGPRNIVLSQPMRRLLSASSANLPESIRNSTSFNIIQNHGEWVKKLPSGVSSFGSTDRFKNHGFFRPETASTLEDIRVMTVQGHAERTDQYMSALLALQVSRGRLSREEAESIQRQVAATENHGPRVAAVFLRVLGY